MSSSSGFANAPSKQPSSAACSRAFQIFQTTHRTCESFLQSFKQVRQDRNAQGAPTDLEQDLLRAMLVFACSGLDSMIKQLIRDALPQVINKNEGAEQQFKAFIKKRLGNDPKFSAEFIAMAVTSRQPRDSALSWFIDEVSHDSLQSKDQIFQVAAIFDIPSNNVHPKPSELAEVFRARNRIIHELDIDFTGTNRKRVPRKMDDMKHNVETIFQTAAAIMSEVDQRC
jgi:hypothetical protein